MTILYGEVCWYKIRILVYMCFCVFGILLFLVVILLTTILLSFSVIPAFDDVG